MWIVCITSVRHVLTVNGYGGRQTKENEKSWCFKGWETLVILDDIFLFAVLSRKSKFFLFYTFRFLSNTLLLLLKCNPKMIFA